MNHMTLLLLVGGILLYWGADWLVRGSSSLALRFGISPLVVGLTVVAMGTSAPELVVSIEAALSGLGSIAVGNVVGSNIFNIAVILGVTAFMAPLKVNGKLLKFDAPVMIGAVGIFIAMLQDGVLDRPEAGLLLSGMIIYTAVTVYSEKKRAAARSRLDSGRWQKPLLDNVLDDALLIGLGLMGLMVGSHFFVNGAISLAESLGVSQALIALTIVAGGTSLPELATTVVATARKEADIAVGNVIGSSIFNILAILGVGGLLTPIRPQGIGAVDLAVMTGLSILLLIMMNSRSRISRGEACVLILAYIVYMAYLWP